MADQLSSDFIYDTTTALIRLTATSKYAEKEATDALDAAGAAVVA